MLNTILRLRVVQSRTGLSKTGIYERMKRGKFPCQIQLGTSRTVGWVEAEIDDWIEERIRHARGETIATVVEQADGLGGLGAGEARKASASWIPVKQELGKAIPL